MPLSIRSFPASTMCAPIRTKTGSASGNSFISLPALTYTNFIGIADQMGIDSKFAFAFRCNEATRDRIIRELSLSLDGSPDMDDSGLWPERPWWPGDRIRQLKPLAKKERSRAISTVVV
jgi:hypothetical protein